MHKKGGVVRVRMRVHKSNIVVQDPNARNHQTEMAENLPPAKRQRPSGLYVIGPKPFRKTLLLPHQSRISTETVRKSASDLPPLPGGHFVSLNVINGSAVAVFRYDEVSACHETNSHQHSQLPVPSQRHKENAMFVHEPNLGAEFRFLYGYSHPYTIEDGEIKLHHYISQSPQEKIVENVRTMHMQNILTKRLEGAQVKIRGLNRNSSDYCPFSGGGDIEMFSTAGRYSAVVSGEDSIPEEGEEGPEQGGMERGEVSGSSTCTPPKARVCQ